MTCCLYRHFDASGRLLYVGISNNGLRRQSQHSTRSHWFNEVSTITVEHFKTRERAEIAEVDAIKAEQPAYNLVDGINRKARPYRPRIAPKAKNTKLQVEVPEGGFLSPLEAVLATAEALKKLGRKK